MITVYFWSASERSTLEIFAVCAGTEEVREYKNISPRESLTWLSWCTLVYDAYGRLALLVLLWKLALSKPFSSDVICSNGLRSHPLKKNALLKFQGQGNNF